MTAPPTFPDLWATSKLGVQLMRSNERIDPSSRPDEKFFYVGLEHIESNTGRLLEVPLVSGKQIKSLKSVFHPGDILYGKLRPNLNKVWIADKAGICSTDIWVLRPSPTIEVEYAAHYLRSSAITRRMTQLAIGANLPRVEAAAFDATPIPLPSLLEQRRIISILREADELRHVLRLAEEKARRLAPSIFDEVFGDPASNPKGWQIQSLGSLLIGTPQNGLYKHSSLYGSGTPIVRITDFYEGRLNTVDTFNRVKITQNEIERYKIENGDVLINRVNSEEFIGKCALVEGLTEATVFESNMMRLLIDKTKVTPRYLSYLLNTNHMKRQILKVAKRAINQASINQQDVMRLKIPVPTRDALNKFEQAILSAYEVEQHAMKRSAHLNGLYKSLHAQAFTGELSARWREQHAAELAEAAAERDRLLRAAGLITWTPPAQKEPIAETLAPLVERNEFTRNLSLKQQYILHRLVRLNRYFTAEKLYEQLQALDGDTEDFILSRADVSHALELFTGAGVVMKVSIGATPTGGAQVFAHTYRFIHSQEDEARLSDLPQLRSNGANTVA